MHTLYSHTNTTNLTVSNTTVYTVTGTTVWNLVHRWLYKLSYWFHSVDLCTLLYRCSIPHWWRHKPSSYRPCYMPHRNHHIDLRHIL
jgi:hypothetical protein